VYPVQPKISAQLINWIVNHEKNRQRNRSICSRRKNPSLSKLANKNKPRVVLSRANRWYPYISVIDTIFGIYCADKFVARCLSSRPGHNSMPWRN